MPVTPKTWLANWLRVKVQTSTPATPAAGYGIFYDKNGTPAFKNAAGAETIMVGATTSPDYVLVREEQTAGTNGGTFTSGARRVRVINTEVSDVGGHCSVASNQITLAAGTYECFISCPAVYVDQHKAWLYNVSDVADVLIGSSAQSPSAVGYVTTTYSEIRGRFVIAATKIFEIQHQCITTRATDGLGIAGSLGTEIYTIAEFRKVG